MSYDYVLYCFAGQVPLDASSVDAVLAISRASDFPSDKLYGEFSRVLKPGCSVYVCASSEGETVELQQVCDVYRILYNWGFFDMFLLKSCGEYSLQTLQKRVALAGFLEAQSLDLKSIKLPNFTFSVGVSTFLHVFLYRYQTAFWVQSLLLFL